MKRVLISLIFVFVAAGAVAWPRSSRVVIGPNEPGQRIIITGRVAGADGHPARVAMHVYEAGAPQREGWLRTADDGSYVIETVKGSNLVCEVKFPQ